jgi:hypothetical protein
MLGREVNTPLKLLAPVAPDEGDRHTWVESLHDRFAEAHVRVREQVGKAQRLQKIGHDRRQKNYSFAEGQRVWLFDARAPRGVPYKLNPWRWKGPYEVRKRISAAVYVIGLPDSRKTTVVNADRLKPCVDRHIPVVDANTIADNDVIAINNDITATEVVENNLAEGAAELNGVTAGNENQTVERLVDASEPARRRPQRVRRKPDRFAEYGD